MFPVPLNSSKITSSIRLPVSTSAVAMIVSEPPLDVPGRPEEALRLVEGVGVHPAGENLPGVGHGHVVGSGEARDGVQEDDHVLPVLDQALRLLEHHLGDLRVALRRLVEGGGDTSASTCSSMSVTSSGRSSMRRTMR
jgi:hypothetical protein